MAGPPCSTQSSPASQAPLRATAACCRTFATTKPSVPILGQIFGRSPEHFRQMAILLCQLGFDGVDINMGCPTRSVAHSGAGAALIKTPQLAQEIVRAVKTGIREWYNGATVRDCADVPAFITRLVESRAADLPPTHCRRRLHPSQRQDACRLRRAPGRNLDPALVGNRACRHRHPWPHPAPGIWRPGRLGQDRPRCRNCPRLRCGHPGQWRCAVLERGPAAY